MTGFNEGEVGSSEIPQRQDKKLFTLGLSFPFSLSSPLCFSLSLPLSMCVYVSARVCMLVPHRFLDLSLRQFSRYCIVCRKVRGNVFANKR